MSLPPLTAEDCAAAILLDHLTRVARWANLEGLYDVAGGWSHGVVRRAVRRLVTEGRVRAVGAYYELVDQEEAAE